MSAAIGFGGVPPSPGAVAHSTNRRTRSGARYPSSWASPPPKRSAERVDAPEAQGVEHPTTTRARPAALAYASCQPAHPCGRSVSRMAMSRSMTSERRRRSPGALGDAAEAVVGGVDVDDERLGGRLGVEVRVGVGDQRADEVPPRARSSATKRSTFGSIMRRATASSRSVR